MPKLKKIRKPSSIRRLGSLDGSRRKQGTEPEYVSRAKHEFDTTSDTEDRLARELRSRELAKRVVSLQKKHPYGTVPELLTVDYLDKKGERYTYQAQLFGGWVRGGLIPDFLVHNPSGLLALLINGNYWHPSQGKNEADKLRIKAALWEGSEIQNAIIVWESRLMQDRDDTLDAALAGIELGP